MQPMSEVEQEIRAEAFDETYEDVAPMLRTIAARFQQRFGGNYDDYHSELLEIFADLYLSDEFDPSLAKWSSWLYSKAWFKLIDKHKVGWRRKTEVADELISDKPDFPMTEWLESLPPDALVLASIVLECPKTRVPDYDAAIAAIEGLSAGRASVDDSGKFLRRVCRSILKTEGWCGRRINEAFKAVQQAL